MCKPKLQTDVRIHFSKRIILWLLQEKSLIIILMMVFLYLTIFEIGLWGYFTYIEKLDMEQVKTTCKYPEFATCEQIDYAKDYCQNRRFEKKLYECKYAEKN